MPRPGPSCEELPPSGGGVQKLQLLAGAALPRGVQRFSILQARGPEELSTEACRLPVSEESRLEPGALGTHPIDADSHFW